MVIVITCMNDADLARIVRFELPSEDRPGFVSSIGFVDSSLEFGGNA